MAKGILQDGLDFLHEIVERVLQEMLEAEMSEHRGDAPYARTPERSGHSNGKKPRTLRTRVGTLNLLVLQDREGTFSTGLFFCYQKPGAFGRRARRRRQPQRTEGSDHSPLPRGVLWQRCQVHYAKNLLGIVSLAKRKELGEDMRGIFAMPARKARLWGSLRVWRRNGEKGNEKVAEHLEVHIEVWITCLAFSVSHRRCIRTTNGLKRLIQEIKPRTRLVRIFPGKQACLRLITALVVEQS